MTDYPFFKVIVLGDSNVGKTSLMNKYVNNKFAHCTKYTIGVDFTTKDVVIGDTVATLQIWDTAGQERYQSVCGAHYRGADCCVLVYDVTDPQSFENLDYWHYQFLVHAAPTNKERFPFVLVGNKVDIPYRLVSAIQAEEWCNSKNQCPYYETSAKDGINVDFAFEKIAELAIGCIIEPRPFVQDVFPIRKKEGLCFKC